MSDEAANGTDPDFTWRSEAYAWGVVVLLTLSLTCSMIDRMMLSLLVSPIKADLGLSDVQISLLHGLAFTVLYVIVGLPMGRLADVKSRRAIAGLSVFSWSLMTAACGAAGSFLQLFLARVGVGVGEAGLSPAANSLIADYFPKERLARPIAFFSIGGSAGTGLAFIFGGAVVSLIEQMGELRLPLLGIIQPWQAAFMAVGLPGVLIALLYVFVREPERKGRTLGASVSAPIADVVALLVKRADFFAPHFLGSAFAALVVLSSAAWMPALLGRAHGLEPGRAGVLYGVVVLVSGVLGLLASGWLADWLGARGHRDGHIRVALGVVAVAILPAVFAPLAGEYRITLALAGVAVFGFAVAVALAPVALQIVVPNEMRGQIYAFYLLTVSILGYAVGPIAVALITDVVLGDEALVGRSMAMVAAFGGPLSLLGFYLSRRAYMRLIAA